ncbi:MAG TPA: UvrD-helicase domain-containing protein [Clostridia bacterium]|nr:UvrD-helicase domain-containing protein [Clostridia bacterium]
MALIECPECKNQISDKAHACPHCGLPAGFFNGGIETQDGGASTAVEATGKEDGNVKPQRPQPSQGTSQPQASSTEDYNIIRDVLISFEKDHLDFFSEDKYIANSEREKFYGRYREYLDMLKDPLVEQYIETNSAKLGLDLRQVQRFINLMERMQADVDVHNERFISRKLKEYKGYFDGMLNEVDPDVLLDQEQRRAVLTDDDHCLLIAGAGAGKTTTMAAKVKYLVDKLGISPDDIIVISYTNKAVDELRERICVKLGIPARVTTFHAFGYDLLRKASDVPPEVNAHAYSIIFELLERNIFHNKELMKKLILFFGYYFDIPETALEFDSLEEFHRYKADMTFETIKSSLGEYVRNIINRRSKKARTIQGEFLRSVQEVQIANFLYLNSIDYEYEKPYPFVTGYAKKQYTPDFYLEQGENRCYIEHFGITEAGKSFIYSPKDLAKYIRGINYKKRLHEQYNTPLITTWASYNDGRHLVEHLEEELRKRGFILKQRSDEEVYRKLVESDKDKYIIKLILFMLEFIEKYKTSGYSASGFDLLRSKTDNVRTRLFIDIAREVYEYYQERLMKNNQIDFADMINDAEKLLGEMEDAHVRLAYKYIIIDEFQDIARQRFNLTKRLADITGAKVVAVGDDWQSIFAFAGADITLFTRFLELMGTGRELQITHTYRNSQELIDIAGGFIQKNSAQIKKRLISPKRLKDPIVIRTYDDSYMSNANRSIAVTKVIGEILREYGTKSSILLIGRYGFDKYMLLNSGEFMELPKNKLRCAHYPGADITYMTAHSSKGLGYDNVVIVNMIESKYGFPSQIENDPIMKLVTYEDRSVPFAEERRLFYVALTRTKNRVYIVAPLNKPSRFLVELVQEYNIQCDPKLNRQIVEHFRYRCPACNYPLKFEFNKNYGLHLYICTNEPEICDFMTNDMVAKADIYKCPECEDGYMIVKKSRRDEGRFYGCTNYEESGNGCNNIKPL